MNRTELEGQWKQVAGEGQRLWGKLTDDDWKVAEGNLTVLAGRIQERYGHTKEAVADQLAALTARLTTPAAAAAKVTS